MHTSGYSGCDRSAPCAVLLYGTGNACLLPAPSMRSCPHTARMLSPHPGTELRDSTAVALHTARLLTGYRSPLEACQPCCHAASSPRRQAALSAKSAPLLAVQTPSRTVAPGFAATNLWHKSLRTYPAAVAFNWAEEFFAQHPFYGALSVLYALCEPSLQGRSPSP